MSSIPPSLFYLTRTDAIKPRSALNLGLYITHPQALIELDSIFSYHSLTNTKYRKTLLAIFARPTSVSIVFADIEALIKSLGGCVSEREGSRVKIELNGEQWRCHRPHPGKEAKCYQVEEVRELLERAGVQP